MKSERESMDLIYRLLKPGKALDIEAACLLQSEIGPANLEPGDVLFDLLGNRFMAVRVNSVKETDSQDITKKNVIFRDLDGRGMHGSLLTGKREKPTILFCSMPFSRKKVDEDYSAEYEMAKKHFHCLLFSYEDLLEGKMSIYGDAGDSHLTIYRGWMLKPETYEQLYESLKVKGLVLINSPEEYNYAHLLPNWYGDYERDTARSVWTYGNNIDSLLEKAQNLSGAAVIKDFVKSRKHEWHEACYIEDVQNKEQATQVIRTFSDRQGEDLAGGLVLRTFLDLVGTGHHPISGMPISEEYRLFIYAGNILCIQEYWNGIEAAELSETDMLWIRTKLPQLRSNFVTMDVARKQDGRLVIIEIGDGQVSGLQQIAPEVFYSKLLEICNGEIPGDQGSS